MPVTAKFSQFFYDRLGHQVADELVDWHNAVDATYRADLREVNELNYARFEAKLEQRISELRSDLVVRIDRLEAKVDTKLDRTVAEHAFAQLNARFDAIEAKFERRLGEHGRWFITAWAVLLAGVIGLWLRP